MARVVRGGDRTVWMTRRDEQMLEWFAILRMANLHSIRWVLGALNGWTTPVSLRQAQSWCSRMRAAGLVETTQLGTAGGSVTWGTFAGIGVSRPDLFRQTTRHEIAVAAVSARYAAAGYAWQRDDKAAVVGGHQADGIALTIGWAELIEVELTGKRLPRYAAIFDVYQRRLDIGDGTQVTYLCAESAARAVRTALRELPAGRALCRRPACRSACGPAALRRGAAIAGSGHLNRRSTR